MSKNYDVIVLGAGAMGSAAAYYLSRAGQKILLLEQFEIDHQMGSSYGYSRIIRYVYDNPIYVTLMQSAYKLWFDLQEASGKTLYIPTGGIDFGFPNVETIQETKRSLEACNIPFEVLSPAEAEKRFPQFRFDDGMEIIYQKDSGLISASDSVLTHIQMAEQHGAVIKANTPIQTVEISHDSVTVKSADETYSAGSLIVTAGAWAKQILGQHGVDLPLVPELCQLQFFAPENMVDYEAENMPVFIGHVQEKFGRFVYGIPGKNNTGVKVAVHGGTPVEDMKSLDRNPSDEIEMLVRQFNQQHLPGADAPIIERRTCLYTMTPDEHFIIDKHPEYKNLVFGAGFSGHGFKFSTLIGSILSDLAIEGATEHDISLFKADRF